jgi:1,4-dihydroxy-2-naphthoate octaprenyltransferase
VAALCGIGLILHAGWPVVAIGLASILSGLAYTAGPFPLAYIGLGDLFVLAFFGPVAVGGTFYVQAGSLPAPIWFAALPVGLLATSILVVNNLRDRVTDAAANKKTLAVRWGARAARWEYSVLVLAAYAIPVAAWAMGDVSANWLLCLGALPVAVRETSRVWTRDGADLNAQLKGAAQHGLIYSLFLSVGVLL